MLALSGTPADTIDICVRVTPDLEVTHAYRFRLGTAKAMTNTMRIAMAEMTT